MTPYISSPALRALALAASVAAPALLTGCAVGPDFLRPSPPETKTYTPEATLPPTTASPGQGGEAQHFVQNMDIPGQWWTLFHSAPLNALIDQALKTNPNLQAAQAALRQAQENVAAARGPLFPQVDAQYNVAREKISGASFGQAGSNPIFTLSTAQVSVSYLVDIWGGTRRQIESAEALAEEQEYQLEATYLTLTSNVVTAAVQEASLRAQIAATEDIISAETQQLNLLQRQFDLGGASKAAVLAQAATLAQAKAGLPVLQKQLAQQRNLLAVLAGRFPSDEPSEKFELASMQLPQNLPLSLPSKLVEQRPDIRAAEAAMHSASAEIGVATANMLPQITLTGAFGVEGSGVDFNPSTGVWSLGAGLLQPIFRGGTLLHEKRAAVAAYDQTAAQYRGTVLTAFQNVADALRALQSDADALNAQVAAEQAAADSLDLSEKQFQLGAISYTSLLDAERTYLQARVSRVQAQAARYADTAALFQALGGGWWNRTDVTVAPPKQFDIDWP
ncbi:MAG TPA: efflux transporter outer membrane subunit [Stellaceae bacterium]|nr:efflux transporter outer membrane subunit [Stellaceae bacterium]